MSSPVKQQTVTQYPGGEPTVFLGPDFRQVGIDGLIAGASAIATLQSQVATMQGQIADLTTRVAALESAAPPPA
ncbi:MAG TPA: hypothetical protein VGI28_01850 [Stellaceae bacterium]|jgi:hypothetical protein